MGSGAEALSDQSDQGACRVPIPTGMALEDFGAKLIAVSWIVLLRVSYSARFCVIVVSEQGFLGRWAELKGDREIRHFWDKLLSVQIHTPAVWSRLARWEEHCFLFFEGGGLHRGRLRTRRGPPRGVCGHCARTDRCIVAGAVKHLAAEGALRVLGEERNAEAFVQSRWD